MFAKEAEKIKSLLEWEIKDTNIIPYSDTKKTNTLCRPSGFFQRNFLLPLPAGRKSTFYF